MPIYRPKDLHRLGHSPKRSLSQNFLIDGNIIRKTLKVAGIEPGDHVLEIGPGPGAITEQLLDVGAHVLAIEKDEKLAELLRGKEGLDVLCADALTFPFDVIKPRTKIVANLPYHITTPIIDRFIRHSKLISSMTLFVQHEVGLRICADADTREYSSFSLFVKCYSDPRYCFTVSPKCFYPAPKVKSCVIHFKLHPFPYQIDEDHFFAITRAAFGKRRKMMRGSLKEFASAQQIERVLTAIGKSPLARPGELTPDEFASFYKELNQAKTRSENE